MNKEQTPPKLEQLLKKISNSVKEAKEISLGDIMHLLGYRSFGPLLLIAGLITLAPLIGDIPGVPTTMGIFVFLIAIQLMLRREYFWLPEWILKKSVKPKRIKKVINWIYKPAQFLDRYLKPRLNFFTEGFAVYIIAAVSIVIALFMPVMEFIPFSANIAGVALTALGLSVITHDGLLTLIAFVFTAAIIVLAAINVNDLPFF